MELAIFILIIVAIVVFAVISENKKIDGMSPLEREKYSADKSKRQEESRLTFEWGERNPSMICPHCNERGQIRTKSVKRKKGVSGGKATAAILTAGVSMLATGLSRKEGVTQAHCCNCNNTWDF
jgi:hypothetical protein